MLFIKTTLLTSQMGVECDECHKLSDSQLSDTRQCLPDKTWSKALPVCVPVTCQEPGQIENGFRKYLQSSDSSACREYFVEFVPIRTKQMFAIRFMHGRFKGLYDNIFV